MSCQVPCIYPELTFAPHRFLGTRPIRLVRVMVQRNPGILALSSRSWLNYTFQNLMHFTPLIFENLDYAWSFSAELCPEGLIGISGSVLRCVPRFGACTIADVSTLQNIPDSKIGDEVEARLHPVVVHPSQVHSPSSQWLVLSDRRRPSCDGRECGQDAD